MLLRPRTAALAGLLLGLLTGPLAAQVHYHDHGGPWNQRASSGPDAEVPGWYYNLGRTGLRVELRQERPTDLLVRYVFPESAADGKVEVGDWIVGIGNKGWKEPHQNGYGMDVFGPDGPISAFAEAIDRAYDSKAAGKLVLRVEREGKTNKVELKLDRKAGRFADNFPFKCEKTEASLAQLRDMLVEQQRGDGSWGNPVHNTFAPLALIGSKKADHEKALERSVRFHAETTKAADDERWLVNWYYTSAGIVLAEYYLATEKEWVLAELQEIYEFLLSTQYMDPSQINPKAYDSHPHAIPKKPGQKIGGWGHNPGFEGYGPIQMITAQGALALGLMKESGIEVDRERHQAAIEFLVRGTGRNGYVWYADEVAGHDRWADMGRTGAAGLAHALDPWAKQAEMRCLANAEIIGSNPQSFPDTHASPLMGMGYAAAAAWHEPAAYKKLMTANRWWYTLAECEDGSFAYQPNRDNAGYGGDARLAASAVTAFVLSIPQSPLRMLKRLDG